MTQQSQSFDARHAIAATRRHRSSGGWDGPATVGMLVQRAKARILRRQTTIVYELAHAPSAAVHDGLVAWREQTDRDCGARRHGLWPQHDDQEGTA